VGPAARETIADLVAALNNEAQQPNAPGMFGGVVLLSQDPTLARLIACWPNVPVSALPSGSTPVPDELPEGAKLRWLWTSLEPDPFPAWVRIAGLPENAPHVQRACWVAVENKMILPDGKLSAWAERWVRGQVMSRLG
jgi:hypothetical protein